MREYGITTSQADYWLHICPEDASFYLYPRKAMVKISHKFKVVEIPTAKGFLVPVIKNLRENGGIIRSYFLGYELFNKWPWEGKTDADVGLMGEQCFHEVCKNGDFMLPVFVGFYKEKKDQYKGKDFFCSLPKEKITIEIKTDVKGGVWGSKNLFVQTHESRHIRNEDK